MILILGHEDGGAGGSPIAGGGPRSTQKSRTGEGGISRFGGAALVKHGDVIMTTWAYNVVHLARVSVCVHHR